MLYQCLTGWLYRSDAIQSFGCDFKQNTKFYKIPTLKAMSTRLESPEEWFERSITPRHQPHCSKQPTHLIVASPVLA
jgi:hypothetical protein